MQILNLLLIGIIFLDKSLNKSLNKLCREIISEESDRRTAKGSRNAKWGPL